MEGQYDHIFWTPCAVHSLNLMLSKIGENEWINEIYVASNEIQIFITNHSMSQAISKFCKVGATKGTQFLINVMHYEFLILIIIYFIMI